jgi:hypothetical protein
MRYKVRYKMNNGIWHTVSFDTFKEALSFKGSCVAFIRKAIITSFTITEVDTSGIICI